MLRAKSGGLDLNASLYLSHGTQHTLLSLPLFVSAASSLGWKRRFLYCIHCIALYCIFPFCIFGDWLERVRTSTEGGGKEAGRVCILNRGKKEGATKTSYLDGRGQDTFSRPVRENEAYLSEQRKSKGREGWMETNIEEEEARNEGGGRFQYLFSSAI